MSAYVFTHNPATKGNMIMDPRIDAGETPEKEVVKPIYRSTAYECDGLTVVFREVCAGDFPETGDVTPFMGVCQVGLQLPNGQQTMTNRQFPIEASDIVEAFDKFQACMIARQPWMKAQIEREMVEAQRRQPVIQTASKKPIQFQPPGWQKPGGA